MSTAPTASSPAVAAPTGPAGPGTLPITSIHASPTNPRKAFDPDKLKQLAETIRAQGFLQRLLVRPWPGKPNTFELVDGERRWRAAKQLGINILPVDVRDLTDAQVIEIQLVAGETGEPLTPIEEGNGFRTALGLKDGNGQTVYTMRSLADKVGCSTAHIQQRVGLTRLPSNVQEWVTNGSLAPRTANLLARIPDPVAMEAAIKDVVFPKHREDPLPYKEAEAVIHERYMVSLRNVPFDVNDATFDGPVLDELTKKWLPQACATCPLKTGNDPERFGDVKDKNVCTKPACYRARCNTAWDRAAAKAKAAGQRVLTDEETAEVFEKNSPVVQIAYSSPYVDVDSKPNYRHVPNEVEDKNLPTWRELIESASEKKGIKVPIVLARDRTGKQWQLVQLSLCIEAARAIGEDMIKKTPVGESMSSAARFERDSVRSTVRNTDDFAQKKKAEADATKRRLVENCLALVKLHEALAAKISGADAITDALLPTALHHAGNDGQALVVKAFGLQSDGGDFGNSDAIEARFKKSTKAGRHALIPVLLVAPSMRWKGLKCEGFLELATAVKLDVAAIERSASAELSAKEKPAKGKPANGKPAAAPAPDAAVAAEKKMLAEWTKAHAKGMSPVEIARSYKTTEADVYGALGLPMPPRIAGVLEGTFIAAKSLLASGKSLSDVSKQLNISLPAVANIKKHIARESAKPKPAAAAKKGAKKK